MESDGPHSSSLGDSSQSAEPPWEVIAEQVDRLAAAWAGRAGDEDEPPDLGEFAADLTRKLPDAAAKLALHELIKTDLEYRWQRNCHPQKLESYARQLPLLGPVDHLPIDVIHEELQARVQAGDPVDDAELRSRFPQQADQLCRLLGGMAVSGSPTCTYFCDTERVSDVRPLSTLSSKPPFDELHAGTTIDDFQLIAPLGSGAFAKVFLARQISMQRLVAVKVSAPTGAEPQMLAQLDHRNIVRVFDQRETEQPPARLLYMEVVQGGTLHDVLARVRMEDLTGLTGQVLLDGIDERLAAVAATPPVDSKQRAWLANAPWHEVVCQLGAELAEGLAYAHSRGVLHRDVKPANVLLSAEGLPKLADFNVSYHGGSADADPTDAFGGSLAYMSPEQLEACHPLLGGSPQLVREQSDVYSLGVMLWELLTGKRPIRDRASGDGGSLVRLQRMIDARCQADLPALAAQLPRRVPQSLRQVLVRCLQPEKAARHQSARELGAELRLCLDPRAWQLMQPPRSAIGRFAVAHPVWAVVFAGLLPNLFTAPYNFLYNFYRMQDMAPAARQRFDMVQAWVNGIAFPMGIAIGIFCAMKTLNLLRQESAAQVRQGASRVLSFGRLVSGMLLAIWTFSGIAFPIAVDWGQAAGEGVGSYLHFFLSLAICGVASTAYPYFLITALGVRYFVPALMRNNVLTGPARRDLAQVRRFNRIHLGLAAAVPILGALLLTFVDAQPLWGQIASGAGLVGVVAMLWLDSQMDKDLAALETMARD